jgi:hypothetical protein
MDGSLIRPARLALCFGALLVVLAGCSDDDDDGDVSDTLEDIGSEIDQEIDEASASGMAEAFVALIENDDRAADAGVRDMTVISENLDDMPGEPEVTGVEDSDGDGLDDDGYLTFVVDDEQQCVELAAEGTDAETLDGACPT